MKQKTNAQVVIAGGGPTDRLMLAAELRLGGVEVVVLERYARRTGESRAYGIQARTAEVLDQRGILDRFAGKVHGNGDFVHFSGIFMPIGDYPTRHPYVMGIPQSEIEPVLQEWAIELGATIRRSAEVIGLERTEDGVSVQVNGPDGDEWLHADYVVGCDGGRSIIRKLAGIGFPGTDATLAAIQGIVKLDNPPAGRIWGPQGRTDAGNFIVAPFPDGQHMVMVTEYDKVVDRDVEVTIEDLRAVCVRVARPRLRDAQRGLGQPVRGRRPAGRDVPRRPCPAGRRRGTHPLPGRRSRAEPGHPGRCQPRVETRRRDPPRGL